ncbi:MAG: type II toxin-antitoxin system RelE/ParE family toxin [Selenomonadaceae bacterium]|nr:type II toxin-antitoxin system RelE/ParE family toxin [Selenomonadaceae bacterium]MBP3721688.1 type II toxin-antitoxin system RelE/ParE family toxin [Selenomonadaceae bacterium]
MKYRVVFSKQVVKKLKKFDKPIKDMILTWLSAYVDGTENPRFYGKALSGDLKGSWRYRIGDYRVIASIDDGKVLILVVDVDHRSKIYK